MGGSGWAIHDWADGEKRAVTQLGVYVPRPNSELSDVIWPGSGIVGSKIDSTEKLRIDFEGDDEVYPSFSGRVRRAAERHMHARESDGKGYPTRACAYVDRGEVLRVGYWDPEKRSLHIEKSSRLEEWLADS